MDERRHQETCKGEMQVESQDGGRKVKKSKAGISTCLQPEEQRGEEKLQERQEEENRRH